VTDVKTDSGRHTFVFAAPAKAFDLNTRHNVFDGSDKIYEWLKANGPKHGFVRTVPDESWHWEFRPVEASELTAAGKFKLPGVEDQA
jgi:LAS superfamily LD-carboxypeptidase LdcB